MADLFSELDEHQQLMLKAIHTGFVETRTWPSWGRVRKWIRRRQPNADPVKILSSLPVVGELSSPYPQYSSVWYDHNDYSDQRQMRLTIAASLHLPEYRQTTAALIRVIRYFGVLVDHADIDEPVVTITRDLTAKDLQLDPNTMLPVSRFLHHEPFGLVTLKSQHYEENWEVQLGDRLYEYRDVDSIEAYVHKTIELVIRETPEQSVQEFDPPDSPSTTVPTYVAQEFVERLALIKGVSWRVEKLAALVQELNMTVAGELPYSSIMLCRAIVDHVPTLFGKKNFSDVIAQVQMMPMDKMHLKRLDDTRTIANDALHRQASRDHQPISLGDLPRPAHVNALMRLTISAIEQNQHKP